MSDIQPVEDLPIANLGPLTVAGTSTWEAITELATLIPIDRWAIVGGQVVAIHAALAGVEPPRVTDDGDVVVDVRVFGRGAMRDVASSLTSMGFMSSESPEGVTRFERRHAKIDLLAPEGIGANAETIPPGYAIQAAGTTQALDRTVHVVVDWGDGPSNNPMPIPASARSLPRRPAQRRSFRSRRTNASSTNATSCSCSHSLQIGRSTTSKPCQARCRRRTANGFGERRSRSSTIQRIELVQPCRT